jgi:hypothetical protein
MSLVPAKDLSREYPRSPFESLAGFPWLPRLIDKVRAMAAGTLGEYVPFPCPADQRFMTAVGVTADDLQGRIDSGLDDAAVGDWIAGSLTPGSEARFAEFRRYLTGPSLPERQPALAEMKAKLAAARPDLDLSAVDSFIKLICVEEGHVIPG